MPINFRCARCKHSITRPDAEAGTKVLCPACNQKLLVPTPPRLSEKTMLGELQPADTRTLLGEMETAPTASPSQLPVPALASAAVGSPIRCVCPQCNAVIKADPRRAGSRASCPGCGCPVEIPLPKAELLEDVHVVQPVISSPVAVTAQAPQNADRFALPDQTSSADYSRPRKYRKSGGSPYVLIGCGLAGLLVVGLCGGFGIVALLSSQGSANEARILQLRNQITRLQSEIESRDIEWRRESDRRNWSRVITIVEEIATKSDEQAALLDQLSTLLPVGPERDECVRAAQHNRTQADGNRKSAAELRGLR